MTYPAKTVFIFGIYMIVEGIILMFIPNTLLSLVNLPTTQEIWIRFVGLAFLVLGYYYLKSAQNNLIIFFKWTAQVRIFQFLVVWGLVLFQKAPLIFLAFAAVELGFGIWTYLALKSSGT